jgi:hypothetical protein
MSLKKPINESFYFDLLLTNTAGDKLLQLLHSYKDMLISKINMRSYLINLKDIPQSEIITMNRFIFN